MKKWTFQTLDIYTGPDTARTFLFLNNNYLQFSPDLLRELFKVLTKNQKYRGKGLRPIKYISLEAQNPILFDGRPGVETPCYYEHDDIVKIHGLIRICNLNTFDDYISQIDDLMKHSGIIYKHFRVRIWSRDFSNYIPYHECEGDAYDVLMERIHIKGYKCIINFSNGTYRYFKE